ncbi:MAG: diguanylate cyclase, partial [Dehalococcoidia bacterium]|nr:diguanylate cyclase [Dehalococcoidia bacterium]
EEFVASVGRLQLDWDELERALEWKEPTVALEKVFNPLNFDRMMAALENEPLQSRIIVPLWSKSTILGVMVAACRHPREFTDEDIDLLQDIASQIAVGIENSRLFAEASHSATTDGLTGLYNHRYFQERLEEELARVQRFGGECSLIMLDLDHFKIYNDLFGHVAGDGVLKRIGPILRDHTRQVDITCRYGGEEFTVILPQTDSADAYQGAERVRQAVEAALLLEYGTAGTPLTVSLGVASCPRDGLSREALIRSADLAMGEAKQRGRNQTYLASDVPSAAPAEGEVEREFTEHLEAASLNTIYALAAAVDARDHYTYGHSRSVSRYAVAMGKVLGLSRRKLERLRIC